MLARMAANRIAHDQERVRYDAAVFAAETKRLAALAALGITFAAYTKKAVAQ